VWRAAACHIKGRQAMTTRMYVRGSFFSGTLHTTILIIQTKTKNENIENFHGPSFLPNLKNEETIIFQYTLVGVL